MVAKSKNPKVVNGVERYDASRFHGGGAYAEQGLCSFGRFCQGAKAEFMFSQRGRSGVILIGLCHEHAAKKVGGEANLPS